jgi:hypothetical protein
MVSKDTYPVPMENRTPTAGGVPLRSALSQYQPGKL